MIGDFQSASFATVSVVMIAVAAAAPPSSDKAAAAAPTPGRSFSIGSCSPISPVEHTAMSVAERPRTSATFSAVAWVFWKPSGPVQAFAPPELSTTASTRPSRSTCRDQWIGAAATRLVVKTAAAVRCGPSLTTRARSGFPEAFNPAVTPAARKPSGVVTLMVLLLGRSGLLSRAGRGRCSLTVPLHRPFP